MTGSDIDWERLKRLRASMTQADIEGLQARFNRDPDSLSLDEHAVLYLVTRERIAVIEAMARNCTEGGGSRE